MPYVPKVYDWRSDIIPNSQTFIAGGQSIQGGLTLGGVSIQSPEPGGRASLTMTFPELRRQSNLNASWTYSRVMNQSIMRVPLYLSDQLLASSAIGDAGYGNGIPWSEGQPWGSGENWAYSPSAALAAAALKGADTCKVDMSGLGRVLAIGHVVGFSLEGFDFAHVIMDISYDSSDVATVEVQPPMRRAASLGDVMLFRPKMLVTCQNPAEFAGAFSYGLFTQPGQIRFIEAMV
ncbi:hypothetical protein [Sulfitobacter sp.]|uniref:hypothetical protein n=1 Tax=Sulfitobacter sp. TaxID=1903071 RepID=UPI003569D4FE